MTEPARTRRIRGISGVCRDCAAGFTGPVIGRCTNCNSPRLVWHDEIDRLTVAHLDCDAFYAAVEKRDNPELANRPVIIGGGQRGVVATACYIARTYGVHSAQPMFKARQACPDAVIISPDMAKYSAVSGQVRQLMESWTPLIQPLSIDEAFLDLSGTERLHGKCAAQSLVTLATQIEQQLGITVSIGLSYNKSMAKLASELDKPRGFACLGQQEIIPFLADKPVSWIWGVGKATRARLYKDGITHIGQLQQRGESDLVAHYGKFGYRLYRFSRGEDSRPVETRRQAKSISAETTFATDISDPAHLERRLWQLCEKVSHRAKAAGQCGTGVTLKLKTKDFRIRTRSAQLSAPSNLAAEVFQHAQRLLAQETTGTAFRLIGIGLTGLEQPGAAQQQPQQQTLLSDPAPRHHVVEQALDAVRGKFGPHAIDKGRGFAPKQK